MMTAEGVVNVIDLRKTRTIDVDRVLGHVIIPTCPAEVPYSKLRDALMNAGFDPEMSREMMPRDAFARACRKLEKDRVVNRLPDDGGPYLKSQFTKTWLDKNQSRFQFADEAIVEIHKDTGSIVVQNNLELQNEVQQMVDRALAHRTSNDVTNIVKKLCGNYKDIIPLRNSGGVYFIPQSTSAFMNKLVELMYRIHGKITVVPCYDDGDYGSKTAADAVQSMVEDSVTEYRNAIAKLDAESSESAKGRLMSEILRTHTKVEAYKDLLAVNASKAEDSMRELEREYHQKLLSLL